VDANPLDLFIFELEPLLRVSQCLEAVARVLIDPALADTLNGQRIQVVTLGPAVPDDDDHFGFLQDEQVLGDSLPGHVQVFTQFT